MGILSVQSSFAHPSTNTSLDPLRFSAPIETSALYTSRPLKITNLLLTLKKNSSLSTKEGTWRWDLTWRPGAREPAPQLPAEAGKAESPSPPRPPPGPGASRRPAGSTLGLSGTGGTKPQPTLTARPAGHPTSRTPSRAPTSQSGTPGAPEGAARPGEQARPPPSAPRAQVRLCRLPGAPSPRAPPRSHPGGLGAAPVRLPARRRDRAPRDEVCSGSGKEQPQTGGKGAPSTSGEQAHSAAESDSPPGLRWRLDGDRAAPRTPRSVSASPLFAPGARLARLPTDREA